MLVKATMSHLSPLLHGCFLLPFMPFQAARGSSVHLLLQNPFLCKLKEFFEVLLNEVSPRLLTISKKNATLSYNAQSLKSHKNTPFTVYTLRANNLTRIMVLRRSILTRVFDLI